MAKVAFPMILLLQIACATYTAADDGITAACKRTSNFEFCVNLLRPYASEFEDKDPFKMGYAAISATLARTQAARAFMVRQTTEPEVSDADREAIKYCLQKIGESVDGLRQAASELDRMQGAAKDGSWRENVIKKIKSSREDQKACYDLLNDRKMNGDEIIEAVGRQADEAAHATFVAQAIIQ